MYRSVLGSLHLRQRKYLFRSSQFEVVKGQLGDEAV